MSSKNKFTYKCICEWSKDDEYGFIANTICPVHGKAERRRLSDAVTIKTIKELENAN